MYKIDKITLAVIANNLQWATEEMNTYLTRAAFSSNIKVRKDCSCALYDRDGNMLAQGTFVPVHLGIMSQTLKELLKIHPLETLGEGDVIMHNNPHMMGSHLFDIMAFKPIFYDNDLIAFAGTCAHHVDIGGNPISYVSKTIYEEGMIIPGVKIIKGGELQEDLMRMVIANVRTPYVLNGDLMAQIASNNRGEIRVQALADKYGKEHLLAYFDALLAYSEFGMREAIRTAPDGTAEFEDYLEHDGRKDTKIKFKVKLTIKGDEIIADFDQSGPPAEGGHNCPAAITYSATYFAVKAVLGNDILTNAGAYRAITIKLPDYPSIVNAKMPAAVAGSTCMPSERVCDVVIGALSKIVPDKVCACDGHWTGMGLVGKFPGRSKYFSYLETYAVGKGAKHDQDGANAHQSNMTNTANAPVEIIELEYPLMVERYGLVNSSGGPGEFRGGLSLIRELRTIPDADLSLMAGRPNIPPYGLNGGMPGKTDYAGVHYRDGTQERRTSGLHVPENTVVIMQTSGGGGWGDPKKRDPEKVSWDALNGYISLEDARTIYGCVLDPKTKKVIALER